VINQVDKINIDMLLQEFIYFNKPTQSQDDDESRYVTQDDTGILRRKDVRKTRLTLSMINALRNAGEARKKEQTKDLLLVRKMYAPPPAAPQ
jgi:hypothetical protein